jgi:hypothetical protein
MRKLPEPVAKSSKNVAIRSKFNTSRSRFHGLFDRFREERTIILPAAVGDTDAELEGDKDRRDTSQHIQRISKGGRFPWLRSLN